MKNFYQEYLSAADAHVGLLFPDAMTAVLVNGIPMLMRA